MNYSLSRYRLSMLVLAFGVGGLASPALSKDVCPVLSGSQFFHQDSVFIPPQGVSAECPLHVRVVVVGGGGRGGDAGQTVDRQACSIGGGGGGAGEIVAERLVVSEPVPVVVGLPGVNGTPAQPSRFGEVYAAGGEDGLPGDKGGRGGRGSSNGGNTGEPGHTNGSGYEKRRSATAGLDEDNIVVHPLGRYTPGNIGNLAFPALDFMSGRGGMGGSSDGTCHIGGGGGAGGFIYNGIAFYASHSRKNSLVRVLATVQPGADGVGFGSGGGGGGGGNPNGGDGAPGLVYVEW